MSAAPQLSQDTRDETGRQRCHACYYQIAKDHRPISRPSLGFGRQRTGAGTVPHACACSNSLGRRKLLHSAATRILCTVLLVVKRPTQISVNFLRTDRLGDVPALRPSQWRRWGSNPQPPACKAGALPIELRPRKRQEPSVKRQEQNRSGLLTLSSWLTVGVPGFEPGTSALSELRSNQLSYTPESWSRRV